MVGTARCAFAHPTIQTKRASLIIVIVIAAGRRPLRSAAAGLREPVTIPWIIPWLLPWLIIPLKIPWGRSALRHAIAGVAGFKHGAAASREIRRVPLQARHDAAHVGNLVPAEPPHVRRTGRLLFPGSAIFLA